MTLVNIAVLVGRELVGCQEQSLADIVVVGDLVSKFGVDSTGSVGGCGSVVAVTGELCSVGPVPLVLGLVSETSEKPFAVRSAEPIVISLTFHKRMAFLRKFCLCESFFIVLSGESRSCIDGMGYIHVRNPNIALFTGHICLSEVGDGLLAISIDLSVNLSLAGDRKIAR